MDDTDAVNDAFRRWQQQDDAEAGQIVKLWVYCYVCRYFLMKDAGNAFDRAAIQDELVTKTYEKVRENRDSVRAADCFSRWVGVICKNTFLNYARRTRVAESVDREYGPTLTAGDGYHPSTRLVCPREVLNDAISRLPEYLRIPARLYFLEHRSFEEISERTGKSMSTVRTYKHKAIQRLRNDKGLQEYVGR